MTFEKHRIVLDHHPSPGGMFCQNPNIDPTCGDRESYRPINAIQPTYAIQPTDPVWSGYSLSGACRWYSYSDHFRLPRTWHYRCRYPGDPGLGL